MSNKVIGVDVGMTKIIVALADSEGKVIKSSTFPSQHRLASIIQAIKEISPELDFSSIGMGCPRLVVQETNELLGAVLSEELVKAFSKPVKLINDAQAGALGEFLFGAGAGSRNLVYISLGSGVGAGVIINKELYRGSHGMAGEIGHMSMNIGGPACRCGNLGCLHMLISGAALAERAKDGLRGKQAASLISELVGGDIEKITAATIAEAAAKGDRFAGNLIAMNGKFLAFAILNVVNVFDPDLVVVGGGLARAGEGLLTAARELLSRQLIKRDIRISLAGLKDNSVVMGAIALAMGK